MSPEKMIIPHDMIIVPRPEPKPKKKRPTASLFSPAKSRTPIPSPRTINPHPQSPVFSPQTSNDKREILFKLNMVKENNPSVQIPDFTMKSELNMMQSTYAMIIKRLTNESIVDNYKQYLIYGSILTEIVVSKFTKINMNGFTAHHQNLMTSYETLFIELGEKMGASGKSSLPVELRLVLVVGLNSIIFIVARVGFTPEVANQFLSSLMASSQKGNSQRKMRAPN